VFLVAETLEPDFVVIPGVKGDTGATGMQGPQGNTQVLDQQYFDEDLVLTYVGAGNTASSSSGGGGLTRRTALPGSGAVLDFTAIPAGAQQVVIAFDGLSTNGTSQILLRLGSGSIDTTGYASCVVGLFNTAAVTGSSPTVGFALDVSGGTNNVLTGCLDLINITGNSWVLSGSLMKSASNVVTITGSKTLAGVLDTIRICTTNGTDLFDAGTVNILIG
jgi:hypothetical protein